MSEESGILIVKAPENILKQLAASKEDAGEAIAVLFEFANVDSKSHARETFGFDASELIDGYLVIEYGESFCSEWSFIAGALSKKGSGIEVYAKCNSWEYGIKRFYALNAAQEKINFAIDSEAIDEIVQDDPDYAANIVESSKRWMDSIPSKISKQKADLLEIDLDEIMEYCE